MNIEITEKSRRGTTKQHRFFPTSYIYLYATSHLSKLGLQIKNFGLKHLIVLHGWCVVLHEKKKLFRIAHFIFISVFIKGLQEEY